MKIDVADAVRNEGEVYTAVYDGPFQSVDFMGDHFDFPNAHVEAEYLFDGEGVRTGGSFSAEIKTACSRCLVEFEYPVEFQFSEYYKKQAGEEDEDEVYTYESDIIDLTKMLQDNIVLELPMKFLCREDCKGLCVVCGADLNKGECGCKTEIVNGPFSRLSGLNNDEEE
jgi:uncharacterized protein